MKKSPLKWLVSTAFLLLFSSFIQQPAPLRILAVGDSITQGGKRDKQEYTYRLPLQGILHQEGISYDFVGTRQLGLHADATWPAVAENMPFDPDHEGYYGKKTRLVCDSVMANYAKLAAHPDVVLVHLGTNDQKHGNFEENVGQPLRELIAFLRVQNPAVIVLLGHLNFNDGEPAQQIRLVVEKVAEDLDAPDSPVKTVHHYLGWRENPEETYTDTFDWAHPNLKGQEKMAQNWWAALRELIPASKAIARKQSKFLGNIYAGDQLQDFLLHWNQVTPENAGKWGKVEAARNQMDWSRLDAAYRFARQNGLPFKLHTLVWGNQQPAWIETLSEEEQRAEIEEWYGLLAARYPDIDFIEVVNEPLNDPPSSAGNGGGNYAKALGGEGKTGYDWVLQAFRLARDFFPKAQLLLNEYDLLKKPKLAAQYRDLVLLLKQEGLIDGAGLQAHAFEFDVPTDTLTKCLETVASTKIPLYITELDIDGPTDEQQLATYQRVFPILWEHPAIQGITLWGWRPGLWRNKEKAYLINPDGSHRPAFVWLQEYVRNSK